MGTNGRKSDHGNGKQTPVAVYIGEMTRELSHLARSDGCISERMNGRIVHKMLRGRRNNEALFNRGANS
jgi:hypothetical protein